MRAHVCWLLALATLAGTARAADAPRYWVEPMRQVHARFTGTPGTFAQFGDSITVTMAFWAPLQDHPRGLDPEAARAYETVKGYMKPACWREWKGPSYGSDGGKTIGWADENVGRWLKKLNPETALLMFGTNDLTQLGPAEYEQKTRAVVRKCLDNGTVVILMTIPPRHDLLGKARQYAGIVRRVGKEMKVPVVDYFAEVLRRRPDDWDGAAPAFKEYARDGYQVPTLISADGVHPSFPAKYQDFSAKSLDANGYQLRNYLTLRAYADVIREVLRPGGK